MPKRLTLAAVLAATATAVAAGASLVDDGTDRRSQRAAQTSPQKDCPTPVGSAPRHSPPVARSVRQHGRRFADRAELRGYRTVATFSLSDQYRAPGLRRGRYLEVARAACGRAVADATWVVILDLPASRAASLGLLAIYFVRSADGWVAWYGWRPRTGLGGDFPRP